MHVDPIYIPLQLDNNHEKSLKYFNSSIHYIGQHIIGHPRLKYQYNCCIFARVLTTYLILRSLLMSASLHTYVHCHDYKLNYYIRIAGVLPIRRKTLSNSCNGSILCIVYITTASAIKYLYISQMTLLQIRL